MASTYHFTFLKFQWNKELVNLLHALIYYDKEGVTREHGHFEEENIYGRGLGSWKKYPSWLSLSSYDHKMTT